jgi:phage-related tail protein
MMGGVSFPMFADGTDSAPGGLSIVGERGPEIVNLPKGSQVFPNGKMPGNDSGPQNVFTYAPSIDARGADAAAVARLASVIANDRQNFERNVQGVMAKTSQNNPGFR